MYLLIIWYACTESIPCILDRVAKNIRCLYLGARLCQRSNHLTFMFLFLFCVRTTIWEINSLFQLGSRRIALGFTFVFCLRFSCLLACCGWYCILGLCALFAGNPSQSICCGSWHPGLLCVMFGTWSHKILNLERQP